MQLGDDAEVSSTGDDESSADVGTGGTDARDGAPAPGLVSPSLVSEDWFRAICERTSDFVAVTDAQGRFLYLNTAIRMVLGLDSDEDVRGLPGSSFVTPGGRPALAGMAGGLRDHDRWSGELSLLSVDGREIPVSAVTVAHRDDRGDVEHVSTVARSVEAERAFTDRLHALADRYRVLTAQASEFLAVLDGSGTVTLASGNVDGLLGVPAEQLVGVDLFDIIESDHTDAVRAALGQLLQVAGSTFGVEVRAHRLDASGDVRWFAVHLVNRLDDPAVAGLVLNVRDVSFEHAARETLQESETRFRTLAEAAPLGICLTDELVRIVYVNDRFLEITGTTREESIGRLADFRLAHPDERQAVFEDVAATLGNGEPWDGEFRTLRPDGTVGYLRERVVPLSDRRGERSGFLSLVDDVTSGVQSRHEAQRLVALLDCSPDYAAIVESGGAVIYLNPAARSLFGVAADASLAGCEARALFRQTAESAQILDTFGRPALARDGVWRGELTLLAADGREVPVSMVVVAHPAADHYPPSFSMVGRDISELRAAEERLAASEAWFRAVVNRAWEIVTVRGEDGSLQYVGPAVRATLGLEPEALLGRDDFEHIHRDDRELYRAALVKVRRSAGAAVRCEVRARHADGGYRVLEVRLANLLDEPAVRGIVEHAADVTASRAAVEDRLRAVAELRAVVQSSPFAIFGVDADRTVNVWNAAAESVFDMRSESALGRPLAVEDVLGEVDVADLVEQVFGGAALRAVELTRVSEGDERRLQISMTPVRRAGGAVAGIMGAAVDVTAEHRARRALERRGAADALVADISRSLLGARDHDAPEAIRAALARAARFVGADAALVYRTIGDGTHLRRESEWSDPGAPPMPTRGAEITLARYGTIDDVFPGDEPITARSSDSTASPAVRGALARLEGRGLTSIAVRAGRQVTGVVTFLWRVSDPPVAELPFDALTLLSGALITALDRIELDAGLRANEERFRAIAENASDFIFVYDARNVITYVSPATARFLGLAAGVELANAPTFVHPDDAARVMVVFAEVVARPTGSTTGHFETRILRADGEYRWLEMIATNLLDDALVGGIVINARDVTERREAIAQLRASEERFRALVQHGSDMITVIDATGKVTYSSPSSAAVLGYAPGELSYDDPLQYVHPDDLALVAEQLTEAFAVNEPVGPTTLRMRAADGTWRSVEAISSNLLAHPAVQGIVVTARDVTERRHAERLVAAQATVLDMVARGASIVETLGTITRLVEEDLTGASCGVFLVDDTDGARPLNPVSTGGLPEALVKSMTNATSGGMCHCCRTALGGTRAGETDIALAEGCGTCADIALDHGYRAVVSVPIMSSGGDRTLGVITRHSREDSPPSPGADELLATMTSLAAIAIERRAFVDRLAHQAHHDPLTGLPNRALFVEFLTVALARARRSGHVIAVLFLDLDRFKWVNDSLGHDSGDEVLTRLAERLRHVLRPGDTVARFGGDEFTVLCEGLDPDDARRRAVEVSDRLLNAIETPFGLGDEGVSISASIGIALADKRSTPEGLLRDADSAMYRAKELGKSRWEVFDDELRSSVRARLETEGALAKAISRGEMRLFYQPVVSLSGRHIRGVEALIRWQHPERGLLPPANFIALAEETGMIVPLGAWVLEEACRQAAEWHRSFELVPDFYVAVNLSARQVSGPELLPALVDVLGRTGIAPEALCVEITESVLMGESSVDTITGIADLGVRVAIDDFGTGYSSLSYLKRFPVHAVKIDRSFVENLGAVDGDSAIVAAVVRLGHALGLSVTAEGVETRQQLAALNELECDSAQGFLFAPALPAGEMAALLVRDRTRDGAADPALWAPFHLPSF